MLADADLARVANLMDGHRAAILIALMGGQALSAGDLAARCAISPSLASAHLSKLLDGGLIAVQPRGRQRHYRLAGAQVADVIEAMLSLAPARPATTLRQAARGEAIRQARTCYDHLAGSLGVALTDALEEQHVIEPADGSYRLTAAGERRLRRFGLDIAALRGRRRAFARPCLDWTERRSHLAGALGAGLTDRLLELGWIRRVPGGRALRLTQAGQRGLRDEFALDHQGTAR